MLKKILSICIIITLLAGCFVLDVNADAVWTDWLAESDAPNVYYEKSEPRTEYRSRTKITTTSYSTSLAGYTQNGYTLVNNGSGTIDYVPSFPSGFNTSHSLYTQYNKTPVYASEDSTQQTTVNTSTIGYIYWHWCRGDHAGAINRYIESTYTANENGTFHTFHAAFRSSPIGNQKYSDGYCYQWANSSVCDSTYWWFGGDKYSTNLTEVYRCNYTNYKKLYNYYKWSNWSSWSTTPIPKSDNVEVQTRTTARYRTTPDSEPQISLSGKSSPKLKVTKLSYNKTYENKGFTIKTSSLSKGKVTFKSKNKKIVSVSSKGKVKIKGCGKTTIIIKVSETLKYKSGTKKISITIKPGKLKITGYKGKKITFKKQPNVSGYQAIITKVSSRFKRNLKLGRKVKTVDLSGYPSGDYRLKIRAYKIISKKKVYGAWGSCQLTKK